MTTRAARRGSIASLLVLAGCGQSGIVEADWQFVDRQIEPIYPGGDRRDACGLTGQRGGATLELDLRVRMVATALDANATPVEPVLFGCERARGAIVDVPEGAYRMHLEVWAQPESEEPFEVDPECIGAPGPRERGVTRGQITDLSVWQFVAHAIDLNDSARGTMDLAACARSTG